MKIISKSASETLKIGRLIAKALKPGDIVCLFGNLGSGKTVLTKGIASELGINKSRIISPTFVLIRDFIAKNGMPFYHFDLYRLNNIVDIVALGYEEFFYGSGITVIEWPDRLKNLMPKEFLKVKLSFDGDSERLLEFSGQGRRYKELLKIIASNFSKLKGLTK